MDENGMKNRNSAPVEEASICFLRREEVEEVGLKTWGPEMKPNKKIDDVLKQRRVHSGCSGDIIIIKHPNK